MRYKLSKPVIIKLIKKAEKTESVNELTQLILDDARVICLFRLNIGLDRKRFSKLLNKDIKTISNLENGTKSLTSRSKAREYAELLKKHFKLQVNRKETITGFEKWKSKIESDRSKRAKEIAHLGGLTTAKKLNEKQRFLRARTAGLVASKKDRGIHKYKYKWMQWSKKGLKNAGKKTCIGPNNELMANNLEKETAEAVSSIGLKYKYEPLIKINKNNFYPDFLIKNKIIECCYWEKKDRWLYLSKKIESYNKAGFECIVVTKHKCKRFISLLPKYTTCIFENNLKDLYIHFLPNGCQPPLRKWLCELSVIQLRNGKR